MIDLSQKVIGLFNKSNTWCCCILLLSVSTIFTVRWLKIRRKIALADRLPGPDGVFLVGMLPIIFQGPHRLLQNLVKVYRSYESSLFRVWICNRLFIFLTQPEDIQFVLTNPKFLKKAKEYVVARESILGQGIFSIEDNKQWKVNRKMVSAGFSFKILKSFIPIIYYEAEILNDVLQKNSASNSDTEISGPFGMATMEIIGKTGLDVTFNAQNGDQHPFVKNVQIAMHCWEYRISHPWFLNKTLFRLSPIYKQHERCRKDVSDFIDEIIKKKLCELNENARNEDELESDEDDDVYRKPKTVVEILLGNYHEMTHAQVQDELVSIMIGGQDTTALTNACAIFLLAHHQDVQQKVFEEVQSIFSSGRRDRQPTYDDLQQMQYLERVIKETSRLYPAVPIIARHLESDTKIGKHLCPADSTLVISPLFLQTSPQFYADPLKFDPDNFLPDACRDRPAYTYLPFSAGPRNCIGIKYAMVQMKIVLSTLVRKNRFFPSDRCPTPEALEVMFLSTLKFVDGCHVKIVPRTTS